MSATGTTIIETVEMHTGGEPVRIVTSGYPRIEGATILDKRRCARERFDHLRKLLIFEPRGHYDMYGVIPVEPDLPGADMAVLFMHNEGYSTMCGHATIAVGRFAVDRGIVARTSPETPGAPAPETIVNIQCPCGLVRARVAADGAVAFESVPAFAFALDAMVDVPGFGEVKTDIGYGGAFYAILPAERLGLSIDARLRDLVDAADAMTKATAKQIALAHPEDKDLAFLYGTILTDGGDSGGESAGRPSKNICVFAEREVDRSPTGSGVTARMAIMAARGDVGMDETRAFSSVTGSVFTARLVSHIKTGDIDAVRVEVSGRAHYTGESRFTLEPGDELGQGFLLR
ncbi:MAG: proline racemase family protein [Dongiaceae bacterium]